MIGRLREELQARINNLERHLLFVEPGRLPVTYVLRLAADSVSLQSIFTHSRVAPACSRPKMKYCLASNRGLRHLFRSTMCLQVVHAVHDVILPFLVSINVETLTTRNESK